LHIWSFAYLVLWIALFFPGGVAAAPEAKLLDSKTPFEITARSLEFDQARDLYVAEGDVVITQGGRSLRADWVTFSNVTRQGVASGHVVLQEGQDILRSDFLQFNVDDIRGTAFDGRLEAGNSNFVVLGDEMRKTGASTYQIEKGTFTSCRCPDDGPEPWRVRADQTEVEVEGYATTRNAKVDILGVPMLWLPWMRWPIRTQRQTGFLLPRVNASARRGGDIGFPFFWAARPNLNFTFMPAFLGKRGIKLDADSEYVFGELSWGHIHGAYISDNEIDEDDPDTPYSPQRWALMWQHDHFLPRGWRAKADLNLVSDNDWAFDFEDLEEMRTNRFAESKGFLSKTFGPNGRFGFVGSLWYADDLQSPDNLDRDKFLLQRLPDLLVSLPSRPLGWFERLVRTVDVQYTRFWPRDRASSVFPEATTVGDDQFLDLGIDALPDGREPNSDGDIVSADGSRVLREDGTVVTAAELNALSQMAGLPPMLLDPDGSLDNFPPGPEGNGRFDEGEPLADRGHRFFINPRVGWPFWLDEGRIELFPELGLHQTFYETAAQGFESRTLLTGRLQARRRFLRELDLPFNLGRGTHLLEPSLTYLYVAVPDQSDNPLFVPGAFVPQERLRHLSLDNIVTDRADRIDGFNGFQLAVSNRIFVPGEEAGAPQRLFGDVTLASTFNFQGRDLGNLFLDATLYLTRRIISTLWLGYDYEDGALSEAFLRLQYETEEGHGIGVRYRYLEDVPPFFEAFRRRGERFEEFEEGFLSVNQLDFDVRYALSRNWALTYQTRYSFEQSLFLDNTFGVEYISRCDCWAIRLEAENDRSRGIQFSVQYRLLGLGEDARERVRPFGG